MSRCTTVTAALAPLILSCCSGGDVAPPPAITTTSGAGAGDAAAYKTCLDALVEAAAPAALARADAVLSDLLTAHAVDQVSYRLEVHRWGDFLQVAVARGDDKYAIALNLGATRSIQLADGHAPDGDGRLSFDMVPTETEEEAGCKPPPGMSLVYNNYMRVTSVAPVIPKPLHRHELVDVDRLCYSAAASATTSSTTITPTYYPCTTGVYYGSSVNQLTSGKSFPRAAEDDRVRFEGIGATLHAPAGMGAAARDMILSEIAGAWAAR